MKFYIFQKYVTEALSSKNSAQSDFIDNLCQTTQKVFTYLISFPKLYDFSKIHEIISCPRYYSDFVFLRDIVAKI